jgi:hypothetical protein
MLDEGKEKTTPDRIVFSTPPLLFLLITEKILLFVYFTLWAYEFVVANQVMSYLLAFIVVTTIYS